MSLVTLRNKINSLPHVPGVYLFKNSRGVVLYVGKAKNLCNRVGSYLHIKPEFSQKTQVLVQETTKLSYIEVTSEFEALILEAALIKKHKPKYNIVLKDDKSYLYIAVRLEKVRIADKEIALSKVITLRKPDIHLKDAVFGPYQNAHTARQLLKILRRHFPFRDCASSKFQRYQKLNAPCLYGHLGLCSVPCAGRIGIAEYRKDIRTIARLLRGPSGGLVTFLQKRMRYYSKERRYEEAARYRDLSQSLKFVFQNIHSPEQYMENPRLVEDLAQSALKVLTKELPFIADLPSRIECYDIAHISGKEAVGAMVVATGGRIDKREYRKFKIRLKNTADDLGMLKEVLSRRFKRSDWIFPDLVVLDGGRGQVSAISALFMNMGIDIPVVGLAKRFEKIVYKKDTEFVELELPRDNEGLQLLMRFRDEAHRFAQAYHHKLRTTTGS